MPVLGRELMIVVDVGVGADWALTQGAPATLPAVQLIDLQSAEALALRRGLAAISGR